MQSAIARGWLCQGIKKGLGSFESRHANTALQTLRESAEKVRENVLERMGQSQTNLMLHQYNQRQHQYNQQQQQ
jgi:hypothetical protein